MSTTSLERVGLPITGMTCASCANRIERRLNKLDGVTASVNYATEKARVDFSKPLESLGAESLEALCRHSWPGNVRELKNFMERLVLHAHDVSMACSALNEGVRRTKALWRPARRSTGDARTGALGYSASAAGLGRGSRSRSATARWNTSLRRSSGSGESLAAPSSANPYFAAARRAGSTLYFASCALPVLAAGGNARHLLRCCRGARVMRQYLPRRNRQHGNVTTRRSRSSERLRRCNHWP